MGKKLDAILRRSFKTSKLKTTLSLAISRLPVLKNQRRARCSVARSDVLQLLHLGHHERALFRVELVIKEQNMLDAFDMIESYCNLLIERISLIEQERTCPEELKEAASSMIYAATRCGEFPELQDLRLIFSSRFGREFVARAVELRNNCGVNPKMIQKLSTRNPSLESKMKGLKEIAAENNIVLQLPDEALEISQERNEAEKSQKFYTPMHSGDFKGSLPVPEELVKVEEFMDKKKYKDVADAAKAAFESAAYAAYAARAAVELSRSDSHDPDNSSSSKSQRGGNSSPEEPVMTNVESKEENDMWAIEYQEEVGEVSEKIHPVQDHSSESEEESMVKHCTAERTKQEEDMKKTLAISDTNEDLLAKLQEREIVFDGSDDETRNSREMLSSTHDLSSDKKQTLHEDRDLYYEKAYEMENKATENKKYSLSEKFSHLRTRARGKMGKENENSKQLFTGKFEMPEADGRNIETKPTSIRTRRRFGW